MDEAVYASIPKLDIAKGLLEEIGKNFIKFNMNGKHHYFDFLNNTNYDGVKGVRDHIMLLFSYYNKSKGPKEDTHHMGKRKEYLHQEGWTQEGRRLEIKKKVGEERG